MPELIDYELNEDLDVYWNEQKDLGTIQGPDAAVQGAAIACMEAADDLRGTPLTPTEAERLRSRFQTEFAERSYATYTSVTIAEIHDQGAGVTLTVETDVTEDYNVPITPI